MHYELLKCETMENSEKIAKLSDILLLEGSFNIVCEMEHWHFVLNRFEGK